MSQLAAPAAPAMPDSSAGWLRRSALWTWQRPWLALPVLALPALWPFFEIGLTHSADGILHLLRLVALDNQVGQGVLYPRWSPELFIGLGYPVFNFYSPFSYYVAELLHLMGLDFVSALITTFAVFVVVSGWGMYALARDVLGRQHRWAALAAATAYMYAPYLLTNVFIRGSIAEVGAQALLPWVFWSVRRVLTSERPAQFILPMALALGGLAIAHNITLLLTPAALAAYILVVWWQAGRGRVRLGWAVLGILTAMGISAFFWLPLIGERRFLAQAAYEIAAIFLAENVWTWRNFLDTTFAFEHTFDVPFQLGLVQVLLALVGLIVARRRDPEWLCFIALAVAAGLGIGAWSLPIWLSSETLRIVQFSWRLLALLSIPLAVFTGAILLRLRPDAVRFAGACVLIGLIILANRPQIGWMPALATAGQRITLAAIPQFEVETGALGISATQEFLPRWTSGSVLELTDMEPAVIDRQVFVTQSGAQSLDIAVTSPHSGPLRFTSLYFPGWQVTLADGSELSTYPSTNLGLVTVDLPPGEHTLSLRWTGTRLQRLGSWISLVSLALLSIFAWRASRPRWLAAVPLGLLILGVVAALSKPAMSEILAPSEPLSSPSLEMLGFRLEHGDEHDLNVYPYWYARRTPSENTWISWQLRDEMGGVSYETTRQPFLDSQRASNWPAGTIVDDAYQLNLPPGLAAGRYQLAVQVTEGDEATPWTTVGAVAVASPVPAQFQPAHPLTVGFGEVINLAGYELERSRREIGVSSLRPVVVKPGDRLEYTLYWQALQRLSMSYHGFIHLIDRQGSPLVKRDQVAGSFFRTPISWDSATLQPDRYALRIPADAANGLYWPIVGLYEFKTVELLPVTDAGGQPIGDTYRLPPIKVLRNNPSAKPQHQVNAKLGDLATLQGYDLTLPEGGLRPGAQFSVTLHYQVDATTTQDFTQFIQLYSPGLGMAAQQDAPPQDGANPTWAWVPGEIVVDARTLQVRADAAPGEYHLLVGLYDPADGVRLPVTDAQGNALLGGYIALTNVSVAP